MVRWCHQGVFKGLQIQPRAHTGLLGISFGRERVLNRIQVVCCLPTEAEVLTKSPEIKHITFIGSEEVGRKVALAAAHNMTPLTLELGGKDPAVILPGTDLDRYISIWMRGVLCVHCYLSLFKVVLLSVFQPKRWPELRRY